MGKLVLVIVAAVTALLAAVSASAAALAQDGRSVSATGVLEKPGMSTYMYGTHAIVDEATGVSYALTSERIDLDAYVGERVTVSGNPVPGYESGQVEGGPALLEVRSAEPAIDDGETTVAFEEASNGEDVNEDGVVDEADDELAARVSDDARSSADPDRNPLPNAGGAAFLVLLAGSGLAAAGYAAYRAVR